MLRTSVRVAFVIALLVGMGGGLAAAAEMEAPLPFLFDQGSGCSAVAAVATTVVAEAEPRWVATADDECTGCSVHNCFFQRVGTLCLVDGRRGRCTANPHICPEIKETTCTCEVP